MSKDNGNSRKGGISFLGLLTILFIALKLTGNIDWNWFWVLSPITLPLSLVIVLFLVLGVCSYIASKK